MKKFALILAAAVAAVLAVGTARASSEVTVVSAEDGQSRLVQRGAVIRVGPTVGLHTNSTHAAVGITSTQVVNGCYLRVYMDSSPGEKVVSAVVDEDETLSRLDIRAGVSGGTGFANIYLYQRGKPVCATNKSLGSRANLWLNFEYLLPSGADPDDLDLAPRPTPQPEREQMSVPSAARAPVAAP